MRVDFADMAAKRLREMGYSDASTRKLAEVKKGGIAVRRIPSTVTGRYYDGTEAVSYLVQVVVARESEEQAIDECEDIARRLPAQDLASDNGSYSLTSVTVYTEPQELEMKGFPCVWESRFQANMTIERNAL